MSGFDENTAINVYSETPDDLIINNQKPDNLYDKINHKLISRGLPVQAVFELTPLCNLKCKMCFVRLEKDQMSSIGSLMTKNQWQDIIKQTAELGVYVILITGGEPFVHPEFAEIYEYIMKFGFRVILFTNAVTLNNEIIEVLKKYPPNFLYVTIYGASEETYEKICGNGKAYHSVINNLKILKDILKNIPISLRTTVIKDNVNDIEKLMEFAKQMQMEFTYSFGLLKPVRGAKNDIEKYRLSAEEMISTKKRLISLIYNKSLYDFGMDYFEKSKNKLLSYDGSKIKITDEFQKYNCMAAQKIFTISWDGKMLPCQNFSTPYTLPLENGVKFAWDELKKYKNELRLPIRCIRCKHRYYCGTCPAMVQAESGTYLDDELYECMKLKN